MKTKFGQAMVEYLLLFGLMAAIILGMTKGYSSAMGNTMGRLGSILSTKLSSGVCSAAEGFCLDDGYKN